MSESKLQHVPAAIKHSADAIAWFGYAMTWVITTMTPILQFGIIVLAIIWGYYRVQDLFLGMELKKLDLELKKLKIRRHEDK